MLSHFSCFNPRTREGATPENEGGIPKGIVSIHAPVKVRLFSICLSHGDSMFQSTHP